MKFDKQLKFLNVFCLEYYMWLENCICVYVHCNKCNTVAGGHILILAVSERKLLNAVLRVWLTNSRVRVQEKKQFLVKTITSQCKIKTALCIKFHIGLTTNLMSGHICGDPKYLSLIWSLNPDCLIWSK